jgi:NAD(P)H-flavin reductase
VVKFDGLHDNFTLHKTGTTPAVFIIGGIGITPVRNIIAQATQYQLPHNITLLYSNKTPKEAPFMSDFEDFAKKNSHFTFVPVMTEAESDEWNGEKSYIDEEMLKRYVTEISAPVYYLFGPAGMVKDMYKMLVKIS